MSLSFLLLLFGGLWLVILVWMAIDGVFSTPAPTPKSKTSADPYNFALPPHLEHFTPVLAEGQEYDITISGAVHCRTWDTLRDITADIFWSADIRGNFTVPHDALSLDQKTVSRDALIYADRELHCYTLRLKGHGKKVSLLFDPYTSSRAVSESALFVRLRPVKQAASPAACRKEEEDRARKAEADRQARLHALIALYEVQAHRADPAHLENYARRHKDKLLKNSAAITQAYLDFRADLLPILTQQQRDDLIAFACWEVKALAIAECLDVDPPPAPPLSPPRPRRTIDEVRAQIVGRMQVKAEDRMAQTLKKLDLRKQFIDALEEHDLDDDERAQLLREFEGTLEDTEEDNNNGFRKL